MGSKKGAWHRMWTKEEKIKIVKMFLEEGISARELSMKFHVNPSLIYVWTNLYKMYGEERLKSQNGVKRI